jgi:hypothetical protein
MEKDQLPPSMTTKERPQHVSPEECRESEPQDWPAAASSFPQPLLSTDEVGESHLFSLGCGEDYREKILQLHFFPSS